MKYNVILPPLVALVAVVSCGVTRPAPQTETRDSVRVVTRDSLVLRDSVVLVELPAESVRVETLSDSSHLEISVAVSDAVVRDGVLRHTLDSRRDAPLPVRVVIPERHVSVESSATSSTITTRIIEVEKPLTWWQRFRLGLGSAALIVLCFALVWVLFKVFFIWR